MLQIQDNFLKCKTGQSYIKDEKVGGKLQQKKAQNSYSGSTLIWTVCYGVCCWNDSQKHLERCAPSSDLNLEAPLDTAVIIFKKDNIEITHDSDDVSLGSSSFKIRGFAIKSEILKSQRIRIKRKNTRVWIIISQMIFLIIELTL